MKAKINSLTVIALLVLLIFSAKSLLTSELGSASAVAVMPRQILSLDADWRFSLGDVADASTPNFDDISWRKLDVPHDWSIEGAFDEKNTTGGAGGFLPSGVGWYRKHFSLPAADQNRLVFIEFDGVMANSDVWINGFHLGKRPYGYVSFGYELTGHLNFGRDKTNVLAVRADNSPQPASRWYTGAGIYRHVWMIVTDRIHIEQWGTFVTTPQVSADKATVHIESTIVNQSTSPRDIVLQVTIIDPDGRAIQTADTKPQSIAAGKSFRFDQDIAVNKPRLWELDHPVLYSAIARVRDSSSVIDSETESFGIRESRFDADTGYWLNDKNIKIKGVCIHHDASAFGAAVPIGVWKRRLETLRTLGVNAIRTAHNPPAPEFLDLCDRMGFLVMDELFDCWTVAKNPYDYHLYFNEWSKIDARDTVRRDRNHPSIILYSVGNEIHDTPKPEIAKPILAGLVPVFHESDPSRPVTQALFRPNVSHDYDNGLADMLDVVGTNYRDGELLAAHKAKPTRKIVGTEQRHDRETWLFARDHREHSGQFLWSGIDYLGESRAWPVIGAGSGLLDRTGTIKPMAYERLSWWSEEPVVKIVRRVATTANTPTDPGFEPLARRQVQFDDWSPSNSSPHQESVEAYSNCEDVELFLNGKSLGNLPRNADDSPRVWKVNYAPGTLKAVAKSKGKIVATDELRSAGKPTKIILSADITKLAPGWDNVSCVTATVVDENGILIPDAGNLISFKITGPGVIAAVDSGDNSSHESFRGSERRAFRGRCFAMIKANAGSGRINISASASGLTGSSVTISAVATER